MTPPKLRAWLAEDLDCLAAAGITPTPAEIVWLAELERAAHTPPGREVVASHAAPLSFKGETYYPFKLRARYWFAEWADAFAGNRKLHQGLYFLAHVLSKPGDATTLKLASAEAVGGAVREWLRNCELTDADFDPLEDALYRLDHAGLDESLEAPPEPGQTKAGEETWCGIEDRVARLCELFPGTTPRYWMDETSAIEAEHLARAMVERQTGSEEWASSATRQQRTENYLKAVRWVAKWGMERSVAAEGKGA